MVSWHMHKFERCHCKIYAQLAAIIFTVRSFKWPDVHDSCQYKSLLFYFSDNNLCSYIIIYGYSLEFVKDQIFSLGTCTDYIYYIMTMCCGQNLRERHYND